ncbi:MAG: hypothetical protein ACE5HA_16890 [Anaerolineae bacterium]
MSAKIPQVNFKFSIPKDEFLQALAPHAQSYKEIMTILETLCRKRGKTLICVTHDRRMVEHVDRVLTMVDGRLA